MLSQSPAPEQPQGKAHASSYMPLVSCLSYIELKLFVCVQAMPYFREDCNAGSCLEDQEGHMECGLDQDPHLKKRSDLVNNLGVDWLLELINKLENAHREVSPTNKDCFPAL